MIAAARGLQVRDAAQRPMVLATGWVLAVGVAETVLLLNALAGVIIHAFIAATVLTTRQRSGSFPLTAMALPSLLRIVSLSVPLPQLSVAAWYTLVGATVLAAAAFAMRADGRTMAAVGLTAGNRTAQLLIAASGVPLGMLLALLGAPVLPSAEPALTLSTIVILLSIGPFIAFPEELVFRGILQRALSEKIGAVGVVLVAIVYTTMFLGTKSPPAILVMAGAALVFGVAAHRSGSILGTTAAHALMLLVATVVPMVW